MIITSFPKELTTFYLFQIISVLLVGTERLIPATRKYRKGDEEAQTNRVLTFLCLKFNLSLHFHNRPSRSRYGSMWVQA